MKQKMYSLDINLYVQQRSLSHEKNDQSFNEKCV